MNPKLFKRWDVLEKQELCSNPSVHLHSNLLHKEMHLKLFAVFAPL